MIKFVSIEGKNSYEIGYNYGKILNRYLNNYVEDFKLVVSKGSGFIWFWFERFISIVVLCCDSTFSSDEKDEMRGISGGANIPLRYVKFANYVHGFMKAFFFKTKFNNCSFVASKNVDGKIITGKITDLVDKFQEIFSKYNLVIVYKRKDLGIKFLTTSLPFLLIGDNTIFSDGTFVGCNGDGSTIKRKYFWQKISYISMNRKIAILAKNYKDAISVIKKNSGNVNIFLNFLVTNGKDLSIVEQGVKTRIYKIKKVGFRTNHQIKRSKSSQYKADINNNFGTIERYKKLKVVTKKQIKNVNNMVKILSDHRYDFDCWKGSISNKGTNGGIIVDYDKKEVLIATGNKYPVTVFGKWKKFKLNHLMELINN